MDKSGKTTIFIDSELIVILGVIIAGIAIQLAIGGFDFSILAFPVNIIFLLIILLMATLKPSSVIGRFGSLKISVVLISVLALFSIFMGLIKENTVTSSWPFVITYMLLLVNLALVLGRRIRSVKLKDAGFLLNHIGLFILLFSAGFGYADKEKYFMRVDEGKVEWRGQRAGFSNVIELPVAIKLIDFKMEEYTPKLIVISTESGEALPLEKPVYIETELNSESVIEGWSIRIDSLSIINDAPAAYITASTISSGKKSEGWVSCGNNSNTFRVVGLDNKLCIAMTPPEPKSFSSQIEVAIKKGAKKNGCCKCKPPLYSRKLEDLSIFIRL